jgi:hypothetical protein
MVVAGERRVLGRNKRGRGGDGELVISSVVVVQRCGIDGQMGALF